MTISSPCPAQARGEDLDVAFEREVEAAARDVDRDIVGFVGHPPLEPKDCGTDEGLARQEAVGVEEVHVVVRHIDVEAASSRVGVDERGRAVAIEVGAEQGAFLRLEIHRVAPQLEARDPVLQVDQHRRAPAVELGPEDVAVQDVVQLVVRGVDVEVAEYRRASSVEKRRFAATGRVGPDDLGRVVRDDVETARVRIEGQIIRLGGVQDRLHGAPVEVRPLDATSAPLGPVHLATRGVEFQIAGLVEVGEEDLDFGAVEIPALDPVVGFEDVDGGVELARAHLVDDGADGGALGEPRQENALRTAAPDLSAFARAPEEVARAGRTSVGRPGGRVRGGGADR